MKDNHRDIEKTLKIYLLGMCYMEKIKEISKLTEGKYQRTILNLKSVEAKRRNEE